MANRYIMRPLLRARTEEGSFWLFAFHPDDRWEITRNGREVSVGLGDRASVVAGVDQFLSLTRAGERADAVCDETVGELLDRLEVEGAHVVDVTKSPRGVSARASSKSSSTTLVMSGAAER
jgi:hypothetical protein